MGKNRSPIVKREMVNGKPHFGLWVGHYYGIHVEEMYIESPVYQNVIKRLEHYLSRFHHLEIRDKQIIEKMPPPYDVLNLYGTVAIKAIAWGRAFQVMKLDRMGAVRYKKIISSGKRRWRKIKPGL